jgi:hypothetical protein
MPGEFRMSKESLRMERNQCKLITNNGDPKIIKAFQKLTF